MAESFADERGFIEDILPGPIDCVTRIMTRAGAIRGNHVHKQTHQWTYLVSGVLRMVLVDATGHRHEHLHGAGHLVHEPPGLPHAWQAVEDTVVLVFTRGPRSGEAYESDTERLVVPLLA